MSSSTVPSLPYDLHAQIIQAAIQPRQYTFSEDETDDLSDRRRLLYQLCLVNKEFFDIAQPLLFSEAVFTQTNVFPRNPQEEERPFLYFNSIENDSSSRLGHAVKHILVQNGSAQISSAILSYLPLLPNIKRISTLCWHLDLPLPEDVLDRPLTKPKPVDLTLDLARFATPSYALIFNHWFDFSELRKLHLRNAHHVDYVLDAFLPLLGNATHLVDLRIDGFGTTRTEENAILSALKQVGSNLRTLHLQSLGTPSTLSPLILTLCPHLQELSTHVGDLSSFFSAPQANEHINTLLVGHIPRPFKPTHDSLQDNFRTLQQAVDHLLPAYDKKRFPSLRFVGSGGLDFAKMGGMDDIKVEMEEMERTLRKAGLRMRDRYGQVLDEVK